MKILILNWRDIKHHNKGGAEMVTCEYAKAWVRAGHKVTWFSSASKNQKKEEIVEGIKIVRRGNELFTVHLAAFFWYLKYGRGQFNLIVDQFHGVSFLTPFYVREKKLAFIHEVTKEVWLLNPLPKPFNLLIGYFGYFIEPWIFRLYRKVLFLTVSDSTKNGLVNFGIPKKNITVIHNGIRVKKSKPFPKKEKLPTIIFLGALAKDKGIEEAIKAFGSICQKEKNFQFWVVGGGAPLYLKKLKSIVKSLRIGRKVKFWGFVSEDKKFELLARAHILINPSIREGWGLVVIEANKMGTPTVAYNSPGLRDSVVNNRTGIICKENKASELAKNIIKLVEDKKLYCRLQKGAMDWSQQFSWRKSTQKSFKLIEKVAGVK